MTTISIATNAGSSVTIDEARVAEMRMNFRGPLLAPGEPGYDEARVIYNATFNRHPGLIIRCRSTADVIDAVNLAREHGLLLTVRGGGHNVAGNSMCDGGLVIDLEEMRGVHLDRKAMTVRAQGGATWGDVDRETQAFGLAAPGGIVSHTGVAGLTLNGGIGWIRNKYGLSCDNLVSAEVVTAKGELVNASAAENADLFWALRGGGGNFGVVTSFEFQVHPVGPIVAAALPMHPLKDAAAVLRRWRDWVVTAPDEVTSAAVMWTMPVHPALPPPVQGKAVLVTAGAYVGPVDQGEKVLQPLRQLGEHVFDMSGPIPYRMLQSAFDPFFMKGQVSSYWKSLYVNQLSDAAIDILADAAINRSSDYTLLNIPHMGGAVNRVRPQDTAFATRGAPFMISLDANWTDGGNGEAHIAWARSTWSRLQPHSTGAVYLNFIGHEERDADALVKAAFGPNYDRLVEIKTKYDPTNMFRMNQNIKPRA